MQIRVRPGEPKEVDLREEAYNVHRRLYAEARGVTKYNISVPDAIEVGTKGTFFGSTAAADVREYLRQLAAVAIDIADRIAD